MSSPIKEVDIIVIGSGQGGTPLARKLASAGLQTILVEKRRVGGTCINDGCTPTKTMISDGRLAYTTREAGTRGIHTGGLSIDFEKIRERKNGVVTHFRSATEKGLQETPNLTVIKGKASFTGNKIIDVVSEGGSSMSYTAGKIFINTGCAPFIPQLQGLDTVPYLNSTSLLDIAEIPKHLLVLGGGYIALELGQLFRRLGSEVSIIEQGPAILSREDEDIKEAVRKILEDEGIRIYTGATVDRVSAIGGAGLSDPGKRQNQSLQNQSVQSQSMENQSMQNLSMQNETLQNGSVRLEIRRKDGKGSVNETLTGSHLLVATGRHPQTRDLHPEKSGIALDEHGYIKVDEYLQTNIPGIYALGDVKGGPAFTHISYNDYVVLYKNILEDQHSSISGRMVPYCLFTDPPLGRVGLTEREAREKGYNVKVAAMPMSYVARAEETGNVKGMMKAVVDGDTGLILGVAILGAQGGEIMTILQMAMAGGIGAGQLREMIFAHPLYAEALNNLFIGI